MVGLGGLEPPTSRLSGVRSNQLSYRPNLLQREWSLLGATLVEALPRRLLERLGYGGFAGSDGRATHYVTALPGPRAPEKREKNSART